MISVRRARALPPPSFRFRLTTDTLGFGYALPATERSRDFHPLERALAGRTMKKMGTFRKSSHFLLKSLSQQRRLPAGTESSSISRCSSSLPSASRTAESSMPQDSRPIIFRGGRFRMATTVLPMSCSGS